MAGNIVDNFYFGLTASDFSVILSNVLRNPFGNRKGFFILT